MQVPSKSRHRCWPLPEVYLFFPFLNGGSEDGECRMLYRLRSPFRWNSRNFPGLDENEVLNIIASLCTVRPVAIRFSVMQVLEKIIKPVFTFDSLFACRRWQPDLAALNDLNDLLTHTRLMFIEIVSAFKTHVCWKRNWNWFLWMDLRFCLISLIGGHSVL